MTTAQQVLARRAMREYLRDKGVRHASRDLLDALINLFIGLEGKA